MNMFGMLETSGRLRLSIKALENFGIGYQVRIDGL